MWYDVLRQLYCNRLAHRIRCQTVCILSVSNYNEQGTSGVPVTTTQPSLVERDTAWPDRVCLIIPPSVFLLDERVFPSLGILRVAAALEVCGVQVDMLDLSGVENYERVVIDYADRAPTSVYGLTSTTPQLPAAFSVAATLRRIRPHFRLVIGGPHATLVHSAVKLEHKRQRPGRAIQALARLQDVFDVVVSGDGEMAVFETFSSDAPAVVDADDPASGLFMSNDFYDQSEAPARHLIDLESYHYFIDKRPATSLISQLGCPFACGFCGGRNTKSLRRIRVRSVASVLDEVETLHAEYGYTGFMFYDDELNVSKQMVPLMKGLAALQQRIGVDFRLRGFIKSELFNDVQAEAMYEAGFRWILVGFESGDPRILENINKKATREDNTRCMSIAKRHGLKVKALMSVGHPGESEASVRALHDWLLEVRPDDFDCTIITTYPGTPYYDEAEPHPERANVWTYTMPSTGDRLHAFDVDYSEVADYYKGDPEGGYHSYVFTDHLSPEKLVELRDWVERDVREKLDIPFNSSRPAARYEHSMGQFGQELPSYILRGSKPTPARSMPSEASQRPLQ